MALYEISNTTIKSIAETTLSEKGVFERCDLQRLLRDSIKTVFPDTYALAEEFGNWQDSKRRIDLLCWTRKQIWLLSS